MACGQAVGDGAPSSWRWTPSLPAFGWYLVDLVVREPAETANTMPVARSTSAFLWMGDDPLLHVADAMRFSLVAEGLEADELEPGDHAYIFSRREDRPFILLMFGRPEEE